MRGFIIVACLQTTLNSEPQIQDDFLDLWSDGLEIMRVAERGAAGIPARTCAELSWRLAMTRKKC